MVKSLYGTWRYRSQLENAGMRRKETDPEMWSRPFESGGCLVLSTNLEQIETYVRIEGRRKSVFNVLIVKSPDAKMTG